MPIKGLTDRPPQFPSIGILRKGGAKENEKRPGPDLTYFRFTSQFDDVVQAFRAEYGDEPRDIEVLLPYTHAEDNFQAWREEWVAGGLRHRCDGETCTVWLDMQTKKYRTNPIPCPGGCKPVGRLIVILPALKRFAYVTVLTTSLHDIMQLSMNLADAEQKARGDLRGVPFRISRRPRMVSTPGNGPDDKRVRREKWLLSIEPHPRWVAAMLIDMQRQAFPMLEAPAEEEGDDSAVGNINKVTGEIFEGTSRVVTTGDPVKDEALERERQEAEQPKTNGHTEAAKPTSKAELMAEIARLNDKADVLGMERMPIPEGKTIGEVKRLIAAYAQTQHAREEEIIEKVPAINL